MGSQAPLGKKDLFATPGAELPGMVREVARALMREHGYTKSRAIATAVSQVKKWAAKGNVKAQRAVTQWEAAKAKARATPNKSDLSNPVYAPGKVVLLAQAPEKTAPKKAEKKKADQSKLPPGATGWKHGWIPVDDSGKAVGPAQPPAWLQKLKDKHKAAGGRTFEEIQNEKAANEKKRKADKAAAPAKKAKAEAERKKREQERATKKAAWEKSRAEKRAARDKEQKAKARERQIQAAYKQALTDRKNGRTLSDQQRRVVAYVEAQQRKETGKLRRVDVPGADGSKVASRALPKAKASRNPRKRSAGAGGRVLARPGRAAGAVTARVGARKPRAVRSVSYDRQGNRAVVRLAGEPPEHVQRVNATDVLEFAGKFPKGQLAFRYRHGWILINPAIPSRGKLGGGLARKHGHKSGSVTHGHFEPGAGGKGKAFVPERSGGPNNPAKLKAVHSKLQGAPTEKSAYTTAAAMKDTGGNALHPSTPTPEQVKAKKDDATKAAIQAKKSNSIADAEFAAKKYADAFVAQKKAGDTTGAENAKNSAQAWAKKAQQLKKAEKASADAKAKYDAEQKAKEEAENAAKKAAQDENDALKKAANEAYQKAFNLPEKTIFEKKKKAEAFEDAAKKAGEALQHGGKHDLPQDNLTAEKLTQSKKKAKDLHETIAENKKLQADFLAKGDAADDLSLKAKQNPTAENHKEAGKAHLAAALAAEKVLNGEKLSEYHINKAKEHAEEAKKLDAAASTPEPGPGMQAKEKKASLQAHVDKVLDDIDMAAPGSYDEWETFLKAAVTAKTNPTADNISAMTAAQKPLKEAGATNFMLQSEALKLYKLQGLVAPKKKTVAQKTAAGAPPVKTAAPPAKKTSPAGKKAAYVEAYNDLIADGEFAKAADVKSKAIAKGYATEGDFPEPTAAPAAPEPGAVNPKDWEAKLPGPGMFNDGNAIMGLMNKPISSPEEHDAKEAGVAKALAEFEKKHGKKFDPNSVEVDLFQSINSGSGSSVPQLADDFFDKAKAAGYTHPATGQDLTNGWKPPTHTRPALLSYTGSGYTSINGGLRSGAPHTSTTKKIDEAFAAAPGLAEDTVTVRKLTGNGPFPGYPPPMEPGDEAVDYGYGSTSKSLSGWSGNVIMEVRIPKGTKVIDVNHNKVVSASTSEQEVILPRGARYQVVSDTKNGGQRRIVVKVVNTGEDHPDLTS